MPSIKEFLNKIKIKGETLIGETAIFTVLIIIIIAVCSFGLGRLSKREENKTQFSIFSNTISSDNLANISSTIGDSLQLQEVRPPEVLPAGGKYVGSKNSDKYHAPWCSGALRIKEENQIWFATKEEAESAGYTPASNCKGI